MCCKRSGTFKPFIQRKLSGRKIGMKPIELVLYRESVRIAHEIIWSMMNLVHRIEWTSSQNNGSAVQELKTVSSRKREKGDSGREREQTRMRVTVGVIY